MSLNRILNLLRYDWSLYKRNYILTVAIFASIFVITGTCSLLWGLLGPNADANICKLPVQLIMFSNTFYEYSSIAMILLVTVVLHHKFTNPRTATAYLTLPGTTGEKLTVMCIDYIFGYVSLMAIYYAGLVMLLVVGNILAPEANCLEAFKVIFTSSPTEIINFIYGNMRNPGDAESFDAAMATLNDAVPGFDKLFGHMMNVVMWFGWISTAATCLFYMVLNLCFKKNAQLKAIAVEVGIGVVVAICVIAYVVWFAVNSPESFMQGTDPSAMLSGPAQLVNQFLDILVGFFYLTPFLCLCLLGILYRQISKKQPY